METNNNASFSKTPIWALFLFLVLAATTVHGQGTRVGFYSTTCPNAESIIRSTVARNLRSNGRIAPGLLRLFFHDCFVRGCDGSVLIEGSGTEKTAGPNSGINGYNVINDAKTQLETACPGVVSCADILALATRDSAALTGGPSWAVPTGRRDGRVSLVSETSTLPGPREPVSSQIQKLANLGLNTQDLVILVGGHTIGTTSCGLVRNRLFNFTTTTATRADPTINSTFLATFRGICPQGGDASRRIELDNGSGTTFDISFFNNLRSGRGILQSDQFLWTDPSTQPIVQSILNGGLNFFTEFGRSMVKLSNVGVLTGTAGEIRRVCTAIN